MEMGSDGSLCRITSSAAEHNNAVIVVPERELEESKGAPYKIVIIGTIQNPYESSEADSDEEIDEKVPKKIEPSIDNGEKANTSSDKRTAVNKFKGKGSSKANRGYNRYPSNNFKNRRPNKPYRNHHNPSSRNSYSQNKSSKIYSNKLSADIQPWVVNPNAAMSNYPYTAYPQFPATPAIDQHLPIRLNCESSAKSPGLLGDGPYSHFSSQFSQQNASGQNCWNGPTDIQNYWNRGRSNNYHRPLPTDRPVSEPKNYHGKHYQQNVYKPWRR